MDFIRRRRISLRDRPPQTSRPCPTLLTLLHTQKHITRAKREYHACEASISRTRSVLYHESRRLSISRLRRSHRLYSFADSPPSAVLRTRFPVGKASAGAICARSLTSKLADSLRLIITASKKPRMLPNTVAHLSVKI